MSVPDSKDDFSDFIPDITKLQITKEIEKLRAETGLLPDLIKICSEYAEHEYKRLWRFQEVSEEFDLPWGLPGTSIWFVRQTLLVYREDHNYGYIWMTTDDIRVKLQEKIRIASIIPIQQRLIEGTIRRAIQKTNSLLRECEQNGWVKSLIQL